MGFQPEYLEEVDSMNGTVRQSAFFMSNRMVKRTGHVWGVAAIMGFLLMAGCAHKQAAPPQETVNLKELVHREIADPVRAEKILALMEQVDAGINAQWAMNQQAEQDFMMLNADYNSTPEQFQRHMESVKASRDRNRQVIMDAYFQVKALTTQKEWDAISKPDRDILMEFIKKTEVPDKALN